MNVSYDEYRAGLDTPGQQIVSLRYHQRDCSLQTHITDLISFNKVQKIVPVKSRN